MTGLITFLAWDIPFDTALRHVFAASTACQRNLQSPAA
jgi:hypothetical protein